MIECIRDVPFGMYQGRSFWNVSGTFLLYRRLSPVMRKVKTRYGAIKGVKLTSLFERTIRAMSATEDDKKSMMQKMADVSCKNI